jgi:hypothetical protein
MGEIAEKPIREFTPEEVQRAAEHFMKKHPRYYKELVRRELADEGLGEDIMWAMIKSTRDVFPGRSVNSGSVLFRAMRNFFLFQIGRPQINFKTKVSSAKAKI